MHLELFWMYIWGGEGRWVGGVLESQGEGRLEVQALPMEHEGDECHLLLAFLWKTIPWTPGFPHFSPGQQSPWQQCLRTSNCICLPLLEPYRVTHMETSFSLEFLAGFSPLLHSLGWRIIAKMPET